MSENSPRWPGRNGSPGLDFSPYRSTPAKAEEGLAEDRQESAEHPSLVDTAAMSAAPFVESASGRATQWTAAPAAAAPPASAAASASSQPGNPSAQAEPRFRPSRHTRKARLRLSRIDPWSVMKTSFLFSVAFGIMALAVVFVLWSVLAGSGALESANTLINTLLGDAENGGSGFRLEEFLTVQRVMGFAVVLAVVDAVIITAVATLFSFLYNLAATVMGGLEVTLAED